MKINYPLLALAINAFGIGTTESSPMGLLPVIARGVDVLIPVAGMLVGAYVVDVMVGTPLTTLLLSHRVRCSALIFLMAVFALGNVLSVVAPGYMTLMFPRILASLNHGAFFDLGSVVAVSVVPRHKQASIATTMFTGLTLANIGGMPATTWLDETIGRRMPFPAMVGLGMISMASLFLSLSKGGAGARPEAKKELAVLMRSQVLPVLLTTVLGAGTMLTLYTYISPVLQDITCATPVFATVMLVLIGIELSIGNYLGGKLADHSVNGTLRSFLLLLMVITLVTPFLTRNEFGTAINMTVWGATTFAVVSPLQMRMMCVASEAPGLSSLINIGTFNLGSVLGAAIGGAVISIGLGYNFVPVIGTIVAGLALLLVFTSAGKQPETVCVTNS